RASARSGAGEDGEGRGRAEAGNLSVRVRLLPLWSRRAAAARLQHPDAIGQTRPGWATDVDELDALRGEPRRVGAASASGPTSVGQTLPLELFGRVGDGFEGHGLIDDAEAVLLD